MSKTEHRFDVSIIIPMEFHRGQSLDCILGWVRQDACVADQYQIVIVAPDTIDAGTEAAILALLRSWDIFKKYPYYHDMSLIAEATVMAKGDLFFFTESHCLPESNTVSTILSAISEHPEWSGFSCATQPIIHNILSEIEAEVYDDHIHKSLESAGWLKVLDQSFLVRREDYFAAGGFRPDFGHFAEWLLAAELHRHGKVIGFYPKSILKHYYVGDINDLQEFTLDFSIGHIKYLAECGHEPTSIYFPKIPELQAYRQRLQSDYFGVLRLKTKALPAIFFNFFRKTLRGESHVRLAAIVFDWFEALLNCRGIRTSKKLARLSAWLAKKRLQKALRSEDIELAKVELIDWFTKLVWQGRLQYLADHQSLQGSWTRNANYPMSGTLDFSSTTSHYSLTEHLGFFDEEEASERNVFRWSEPTAFVWLPLYEGRYRINIEWLEVRHLLPLDLLNLELDDCPIDRGLIEINDHSLIIEVVSSSKALHKLSWAVTPFPASNDSRLLGLPVRKINWSIQNEITLPNIKPCSLNPPLRPAYFLHIHKCAGTSIRLLMDNMYEAGEIMSPHAGKYYPEDLQDTDFNSTYAFYRGHFRWVVPSVLPEAQLSVVTILRDPVDRILSLFYYLKQLNRVHESLLFEEWFEHHLRLEDTITANFLPISADSSCVGSISVQQQTLMYLNDAQNNLKKCLVVGLVEHIEESLNILAWQMNLLAPSVMPRNNSTLHRSQKYEISEDLRHHIESVLSADVMLYNQASERFALSMREMRDQLSSAVTDVFDYTEVRDSLRLRYIEQMALSGKELTDHAVIEWTPDNVFYGDNLQPRELYQDGCLRWTGPNQTINFYFYLGEPRDMQMCIRLYAVTPDTNALSTQLKLNGAEVTLSISRLVDGAFEMIANLNKETLGLSYKGVAAFMLTSATVRGEGEFRQLGLALKGISIQESNKVKGSLV
jgi:hypothetical protein